MSKVSVDLSIPRILGLITIRNELFFKLRLSFDGLVSSNNVLLESSNRIETHLDVIVEVIEVHSNAAFEFCLDEDFIKFW